MLASEATFGAVRSPKTAELVARTLRKMVVDGQLYDRDRHMENAGAALLKGHENTKVRNVMD
jgi:hypothetical protein